MKEAGFNAVQIGPVQPLKEEREVPWFLLYQPIDFRIGNYYSSYDEIKELCSEGRKLGVRIIVDVVLNHVAGVESGEIYPHEKVNEVISKRKEYFKINEMVTDWNDRRQVIEKSIGLPCLRLENYEIQEMIIKFLKELIDIGVGGFRFDAAKHIALPSEGSDFWIRIKEELSRYDLFNYAEVIFTEKNILEEYSKYINVLTENVELENTKLVTFVESHDSYLEFGYTKELSSECILEKYRKLCKNYKNTLFYARPFDESWKRVNR